MKAIVVFFLTFCFLLLGGYQHGFASNHCKSTWTSFAQHTDKIQQTKFINANQGFPEVKNNSLSEKKEDLISVEDDDDDLVFSRKYVLLVRNVALIAFTSVLICLYRNFKSRIPFCRHLSYTASYKYILQRVLRL